MDSSVNPTEFGRRLAAAHPATPLPRSRRLISMAAAPCRRQVNHYRSRDAKEKAPRGSLRRGLRLKRPPAYRRRSRRRSAVAGCEDNRRPCAARAICRDENNWGKYKPSRAGGVKSTAVSFPALSRAPAHRPRESGNNGPFH
jgi:hypothetical protein